MPAPAKHLGSRPEIKVDGQDLSPRAQGGLVRTVIDTEAHLPDMFTLHFHDSSPNFSKDLGMKFGSEIVISAAGDSGDKEKVLTGEVTGFEQLTDGTGTWTIVRGYDPTHRLSRGRHTRTFTDVSDADIVRQVAGDAGVKLGDDIDSSGPMYEYLSQVNLTDWEFLRARAHETGHELTSVDGKLVWRLPADSSTAPSGDQDVSAPSDPLQLMLSKDLHYFRPRVTAAEQVSEVQVRGWDPAQKQAVVGSAPPKTISAKVGVTPEELASTFSAASYVVVDRPVTTQSDADAMAKAVAEQIAGVYAECEGKTRGNPHIKPGAAVAIAGVGWPHDGSYVVTGARHTYDEQGYSTEFRVTGRQERSLLGLTSMGATTGARRGSGPPMYGLVIGQVTDAADPDNMYRVKVKFPWLSDDYESWWCRVATIGAGANRGITWLPEVGDEVLVGFLHGDTRVPFVVGSLFNGVDTPPNASDLVDSGDGSIKQRAIISRTNQRIVLSDDASSSSVLVSTGDDKMQITLDKDGITMTVDSSGKITMKGGSSISIKADSDVTIEASGSLSLKGAGVKIDGGSSTVEVKGSTIKLN